jgi:drug/metabolite transporter (DMT)-like permease
VPEKAAARRALAALVVLCLIWGYAWIAMKYALDYAGPFYTAALRSGVATVCLFGMMFALRRDLRLRAPLPIVLLSVFQSAFIALTLWALSLGEVGRVAVLNFTMPFWVALLAWPLLGERVRARQWMAIAVAFTGLLCVAQPWEFGDKFASALLATCSGLSWAIATIIVKRYRTALQSMDALALTAWQMLIGAAPLMLLAWVVPEREASWTPQFWAAIAYLGVIGTAVAWLLWTYIITKLPASVASLNTLAIPALAVLFAWLQFGERPNGFESAGMLLIALGLLQLWWISRRQALASGAAPVRSHTN